MTEEIIRKKIKLTEQDLWYLCIDQNTYEYQDKNIEWVQVQKKHEGGTRHTQVWSIVVKSPEGEFYTVSYEDSVKDSMGWDECNAYHDCILTQVFPHEKTIIEYK